MEIFRIEHPQDGKGPFVVLRFPIESKAIKERLLLWRYEYIHPDAHPTPVEDGLENFLYESRYKIVFGCPSIEVIIHWFGPVLKELEQVGYTLTVYDVDARKVKFGRRGIQVAFYRDHDSAKVIRTMKPTEIES